MIVEVQNDLFLDIYNLATANMKAKEIKSFSEKYFQMLESEDVDLEDLLDLDDSDYNRETDFHKHLSLYLEIPEEDEIEVEDYD